ncbi:uncharacterized protein LACBIDRAFT_315127 [Laccaria bicolor S238N-H82]|uniref:Predicted protein n=1 Tax=Laccaria bicolor (strain S238N-H82 / ATCC MYA-4686) TaxID=486041 RepID=B0DZW2_LACBS|nr:uncharacterized protein LACBIDRAFT_315127 [Laccaria bicolor S238N-H82]EDQ99940.1 predicted protein [Laccaria bicolor S238N-H82]|eukprot:XP_001889483.1 predicted protein [Laccaria bicolor S238N-H82]
MLHSTTTSNSWDFRGKPKELATHFHPEFHRDEIQRFVRCLHLSPIVQEGMIFHSQREVA